jgi:hypothetical protein
VVAQSDAQAGHDHVEGKQAPHHPVDIVFKKKNWGGNDSKSGDDSKKGGIDPVNPMEGNS